jgi:two-component sensor histidine kinase
MFQVRSITGHLLFYALALVLPILVMSGFIGWAYLKQEERRIDSLAEAQVAAVSSDIQNRLDAIRATLNVLSVGPSVVAGDVGDIRRLLEQIAIPQGVWFTLRDQDGRQLLNTRMPSGEPLPTFKGQGDPVIFKERKPYTSNLIWAPLANNWAVTVSVPVKGQLGSDEVKYALSAVIPAAYFQSIFERVPRGWVITINDRPGKIVARSQAPEQWVGRPMSPTGWAITKDVPPGQGGLWRNVYSLEGTRVRGAYHRMADSGWLVGVAALPNIYEAPQKSLLRIGAALLSVCLLTSTILAFFMGRRVTKAVEVLQIKAAAMRDMRLIDFPRTSLDEVNTVANIMRDTAQVLRARQQQQTTLIQELNHRVKNTLATVLSISRMTLKNSKDMAGFEQTFSARLLALSATHDLLTNSAWEGVELHELLATELQPFQGGNQVSMDGPRVSLTSKIAVALGMAVHEMGTNAAKYGALQDDTGQITIRWQVATGILDFEWQESCSRTIEPPTRKGFGTLLIEQTIQRELQGTVNTEFRRNGLHSVFNIPLGVHDRISTA